MYSMFHMESVRRFWFRLPSSFPPNSHVRDLTPVELKNTKVVQDLHALYGMWEDAIQRSQAERSIEILVSKATFAASHEIFL
jgi:hypothetical protein